MNLIRNHECSRIHFNAVHERFSIYCMFMGYLVQFLRLQLMENEREKQKNTSAVEFIQGQLNMSRCNLH